MKLKTSLVLLCLLFLSCSCVTVNRSVVTLTGVVDSAMKSWAALSVNGMTTPAIDAKVTKAHDKYRAACAVAETALMVYKQTGNNRDYIDALRSAQVAADAIIELVVPLLSKAEGDKLARQMQNANVL